MTFPITAKATPASRSPASARTGCCDVDGIIIPATRRGYAWQGDYQLVPEPLLVAIDMGESDPVDPAAAIRGFLDALGVPGQRVPAEPQAQAGLYRSLLAVTRD